LAISGLFGHWPYLAFLTISDLFLPLSQLCGAAHYAEYAAAAVGVLFLLLIAVCYVSTNKHICLFWPFYSLHANCAHCAEHAAAAAATATAAAAAVGVLLLLLVAVLVLAAH
jgi:hypothetical protein